MGPDNYSLFFPQIHFQSSICKPLAPSCLDQPHLVEPPVHGETVSYSLPPAYSSEADTLAMLVQVISKLL